MEILSILETLEEIIEKSRGIPFTGNCIADREEILEIIKEMRLKLPDDIKQAKWVKDERQRILLEAQKEAENIKKDAENRVSSLISEHEIAKMATEQANNIILTANKTAKEIKHGTKEYADGILSKIQEILKDTVDVIEMNRKEL